MGVGTVAEGNALVTNAGSGLEAGLRVGRRVHLAEVVGDGLVVGLGGLEGLEGKSAAGLSRDLALSLPLGNDGIVVRGRADDRGALVVLSSGTEEGDTANVDLLDSAGESAVGLGGLEDEGVEVADNKGDLVDAVVGEVGLVALDRTCEDTAVDRGVEGLDAAAEHLGRVGNRAHIPALSARCKDLRLTQSRGRSRG